MGVVIPFKSKKEKIVGVYLDNLWKIYECDDCEYHQGYTNHENSDEKCPKCNSENYTFIGYGE